MGIGQIAEWLGVGERHVRRLISERRIPYVKWGHYIRFDPVQVDEWLRSNRIAPMRALGTKPATGAAPHPSEPAPTLGAAMDGEDLDDEFRQTGESLRSLRQRAGMNSLSQEIQEARSLPARTLEDVSSGEEGS
jgi:excisionase family DNA binding protein